MSKNEVAKQESLLSAHQARRENNHRRATKPSVARRARMEQGQ